MCLEYERVVAAVVRNKVYGNGNYILYQTFSCIFVHLQFTHTPMHVYPISIVVTLLHLFPPATLALPPPLATKPQQHGF